MKKVVFPGNFDPLTLGHVDIIKRGSELFDELIVLVQNSMSKNSLFDVSERVEIIKKEIAPFKNVRVVEGGSRLTVTEVETLGAEALLRGIRSSLDYEIERSLDGLNHSLAGLETIFLMTRQDLAYVSSSLVKEIAKFGDGQEAKYLPKHSLEALAKKKQSGDL